MAKTVQHRRMITSVTSRKGSGKTRVAFKQFCPLSNLCKRDLN